jgi:hypothetical protein
VKDALTIAAPILLIAMLYCLWRAIHMFRAWCPAAATVWKSGYGELDQQDDFWHFGFTLGTRRGWNWRDGENARLIEDEIIFTDDKGTRHRAMVERRVRRGWRPSNVYTVWYDPARPDGVTTFGPGYWLLMAAVCGCLLAGVFSIGMQLARG